MVNYRYVRVVQDRFPGAKNHCFDLQINLFRRQGVHFKLPQTLNKNKNIIHKEEILNYTFILILNYINQTTKSFM